MTRPTLRCLFWGILFVTGLLMLSLLMGCSTPVVINKAVPSKAVSTETIRRSIVDAREKTKSADKKAEEQARNLRDISIAFPKVGNVIDFPTYDLITADLEAAAASIEEQRKDLASAQEYLASALEERAAVQEVADNLHAENVRLTAAVNSASSVVAELSAKVSSASARGRVYLRMLIGLALINVGYAVAKFYFHVPFL